MTLAPPAPYKLETRGLGKRYQLPVLEGLSLGVAPGEVLCLPGPNGSGMTTLLRILAGLEVALAVGTRVALLATPRPSVAR
jgi:simple sugar transport system ATP-binding protein